MQMRNQVWQLGKYLSTSFCWSCFKWFFSGTGDSRGFDNFPSFGLTLFKNTREISQAIDLYSQAIELNSRNDVYFVNRAFAHLRLEKNGSAILDAIKAIELKLILNIQRFSNSYIDCVWNHKRNRIRSFLRTDLKDMATLRYGGG